MSELKNCPFCGGKAQYNEKQIDMVNIITGYDCSECGSASTVFIGQDQNKQLKSDARAAWNCRAEDWTPVSEGFPEEYTMVLGWDGDNIVRVEYAEGVWHGIPDNTGFLPDEITHWMPLPSPPEGE